MDMEEISSETLCLRSVIFHVRVAEDMTITVWGTSREG